MWLAKQLPYIWYSLLSLLWTLGISHNICTIHCSQSGYVNLDTKVPDTLTTWFSEAYGLHTTTGLGIARRTQLTVVKQFFVSLELPFSVNFGEAVTVSPLVFNLLRKTPSVNVSHTLQFWSYNGWNVDSTCKSTGVAGTCYYWDKHTCASTLISHT